MAFSSSVYSVLCSASYTSWMRLSGAWMSTSTGSSVDEPPAFTSTSPSNSRAKSLISWLAPTRVSESSTSFELPSLPAAVMSCPLAWSMMPAADPPRQAASGLASVRPARCCAEMQRDVRAPLMRPPMPVRNCSACWHDMPLNCRIWFTMSCRYLTMSHMVGAA